MNFTGLCDDMCFEIMMRCELQDLFVCKQVCKRWHSIARSVRCSFRERALDLMYGRNSFFQNWQQGIKMMGELANVKDDYAMMIYGWYLYEGNEFMCDWIRAEELIKGSTHVCARALCLYRFSRAKDERQAFQLLLSAPDQSDPHLLYLLGTFYYNGVGCQRDYQKALQCYQRADTHPHALFSIGFVYGNGSGVPRDCARALHYFRQASRYGISHF